MRMSASPTLWRFSKSRRFRNKASGRFLMCDSALLVTSVYLRLGEVAYDDVFPNPKRPLDNVGRDTAPRAQDTEGSCSPHVHRELSVSLRKAVPYTDETGRARAISPGNRSCQNRVALWKGEAPASASAWDEASGIMQRGLRAGRHEHYDTGYGARARLNYGGWK